MEKSVLYYGDNLPILRNTEYFPSASIDLVYLDPPFNSNQDYNVLFAEQDGSRSAAQIEAFTDTWRWDVTARRTLDEVVERGGKAGDALLALQKLVGESDMLAYLSMMAPRLVELRRVLKPTGSLFLHCDPSASHYIKVLLDAIFGSQNFRNEVVWKRSVPHNDPKKFGATHDVILFYCRGPEYTFNQVFIPQSEAYKDSHYTQSDPDGRIFRLQSAVATGQGPPRVFNGKLLEPPPGTHWRWSQQNIDELLAAGRIVFTRTGTPNYKRYLDESKGSALQSVWTDIPPLNSQAQERLGYPTQKPEALLSRIIESGSNEGDTVLDPFCGCGTTVAAAQRLGRRWIGIDITHLAITLIRSRLADAFPAGLDYRVVGEPADLHGAETLAKSDRYQFQWWALGVIGARPAQEERKKGADSGIDGKLYFREKENRPVKTMVIQVKSGTLKLSEVRDFARVIEREKAEVGVLLTLDEPTRDMRVEAATLGFYKSEYRLDPDTKYDRYQILTIRELFEGKRPQYPPFRNVTFKVAPLARPTPKASKARTKKLPET